MSSVDYIDCTPAELLIDTGAIASLVGFRVLKRIGQTDEPLRPSKKALNGVTGHKVCVKGEINLPIRLSSQEMLRPFVVVEYLHVDAVLGTDTLKAYRALIDLNENTILLKDTNEVVLLGSPRVEEMYSSRVRSTVRLAPES